MTTFDDRERAFENRFAHDEELAFRAQARRNHDVGLWAAHQLGKTGEDAEAYASSVLMMSIAKGGTDNLVTRIHADFAQRGLTISEHQIRRRMDETLAQAVDQIRAE